MKKKNSFDKPDKPKVKGKPKTSLQFKLALLFFAVMFISASVSVSALFLIFSPIMKENSEQQLKSIVSSMNDLSQAKENYTIDELITFCTNSSYSVNQLSPTSKEVILNKSELDEGKVVTESTKFIPSVTVYAKVGDTYLRINSFTKENIYWMVIFVIIIAFMVCIAIGTFLTAIISRDFFQPVRDLNRATSEVAKGNFNVRVRIPTDPEYAALAENFNKMAQELSGIETLRGDFTSNVSHEFKTPLASIQGFAKLLQDESISDEERQEYTQIIIDETSRLTKLSTNILRLSKLENQSTIANKKRFSLDEQIRSIILVLEPEWSRKNIDLDIALDDIYYYGNEELMGQIWQNIINNAIKFTPDGGIIRVQLYQTDKNITAKIYDNGESISEETRQKIFEKFYQGDHSRKTEGNGLGLALVKRIVDLCEGNVYAENVPEGGVCFVVELPFVLGDMK